MTGIDVACEPTKQLEPCTVISEDLLSTLPLVHLDVSPLPRCLYKRQVGGFRQAAAGLPLPLGPQQPGLG